MQEEFAKTLKDLGASDEAVAALDAQEVQNEADMNTLAQAHTYTGALYSALAGFGIKAKSAAAIANRYQVALKSPEPAAPQPTVVSLIDPDKQCPHCQSRLSDREVAANKCAACGKVLWRDVTCPYCGNSQPQKGDKPRCIRCSRPVPTDATKRRRLSWLRVNRGVNDYALDTELANIDGDAIRLEALDHEIEEGGAIRPNGGFRYA